MTELSTRPPEDPPDSRAVSAVTASAATKPRETWRERRRRKRPPTTLSTPRRIWRERWMYFLIFPGLLYFVVFQYVPLYGNMAAWQDYSPFLGLERSLWVGWDNFERIFVDPELIRAFWNTLLLSGLQIFFAFPAPLALAIMLHSILSDKIRRVIQAIVYLPHFIGWVIVVSIWNEVLGPLGVLNGLLGLMGVPPVDIIGNPDAFPALVTFQVIWKEVGWGTIIFLAALVAIPTELYESAAIDRAGPWRRLWHVTLPGMSSIIVLLLILRLGSVLTVGFEQIILQQPIYGADASQTLDTFVYFRGINGGDWGLATAAGLVKGVIASALVIGSNWFAKKMGGEGIF